VLSTVASGAANNFTNRQPGNAAGEFSIFDNAGITGVTNFAFETTDRTNARFLASTKESPQKSVPTVSKFDRFAGALAPPDHK